MHAARLNVELWLTRICSKADDLRQASDGQRPKWTLKELRQMKSQQGVGCQSCRTLPARYSLDSSPRLWSLAVPHRAVEKVSRISTGSGG